MAAQPEGVSYIRWTLEVWDSRTGEILMSEDGIEPAGLFEKYVDGIRVTFGQGPQRVTFGTKLGMSQQVSETKWMKAEVWAEGSTTCNEGPVPYSTTFEELSNRVISSLGRAFEDAEGFVESQVDRNWAES